MPTRSKEERHSHWEGVYRDRPLTEVSWFQSRPDISLELIHRTGLPHDARIVDVGGGASTLVDHLLETDWSSVLVLDSSGKTLAQCAVRPSLRSRQGPELRANLIRLAA